MSRLRHLRTKLGLLYTALFVGAMLALAVTVYAIVERNAEDQVNRELVAAGTVFDRLWQQRTTQLGGAAGLLARDYGFRAAVATGDQATIGSALTNLKHRLHVPIAFVVGEDGSISGIIEPRGRAEAAALWGALDAGQLSGVARLGGTARHVIAAPILAPTLVGWVVFATNLDRPEMRSFVQLSSIPLDATVLQQGGSGWAEAGRSQAADPALSRFVETALG